MAPTPGNVTGTVARFTQQQAEESAVQLAKVKDDQKRLVLLRKEIADLQKENETAARELAGEGSSG